MAKKKNGTPRTAGRSKAETGKQRLKKEMIGVWCVAGAFVLLLLAFLGYRVTQSDWYLRHAPAVTVNGHTLSVVDYNFYFHRAYQEYINNTDESVNGFGGRPDTNAPLAGQRLGSDETTWLDFFNARTETLIRQTYYYYDMAEKNGYTLNAAQEEDIDYDFQEKIWFEAEELQRISVDEYLADVCGRGMTEEIYRENLRILFTARFYMEEYAATIAIPAEELAAYYSEHEDEYAIVTYRLFYLSGKADTEAEQENKMALAETRIRELAAAATDEASFVALAEEYSAYNDSLSYWEGASREYCEQIRFARAAFREWFAAPERKNGDVEIARGANGWYAAQFLSRSDNDYPTADLLYFTISGDEPLGDARSFVAQWEAGERTAESFFDLSADVRDIDYSKPHRKIETITYPEQTLASVPDALREWAFDSARQSGDVTILRKDSGSFYVAYYVGPGRLARDVLAYGDLSREMFEQQHRDGLEQVALTYRRGYGRTQDK